jgi:hypothetical protein
MDARLLAATVPDDRPFLFGGWFSSRFLQTCSGGIGAVDPNPLGARGCSRWAVAGAPGSLHFGEGFAMPEGDGPIVLRAHSRDRSAATCLPENVDRCREKIVVEAVAWFGDETTAAVPLGPTEAQHRVLRLSIADSRDQPDGSSFHVPADLFLTPLSCASPWPNYVFRVHGDARHGLLAVFPDEAARADFEAANPPGGGVCLGTNFPRPGPAQWVPFGNALVLTFGDAAFVDALSAAVVAGPDEEVRSVGLLGGNVDQAEMTLSDYLTARAAGLEDRALGERFVPLVPLGAAEEVQFAITAGWSRDTLRRAAGNALAGTIERLDDPLDAARIGPDAVALLSAVGAHNAALFRVTYPAAKDAALRVEEYVVWQDPDTTFRDWQLTRIAGAPYPPGP